MSKVKFGWSEVDITPKKGVKISLAGQFFERITDEVESPISITALCIKTDDDYAILCSCDLVGVKDTLYKAVCEKLKKETKINPDKVTISAIHTHTSYVYAGASKFAYGNLKSILEELMPEDMSYVPLVSGEDCMSPEEVTQFLIDKIFEAIVKAYDDAKDGYYKNGFGRAVVGMCRRVVYDDYTAKMWGEATRADFMELEGGNDSGIELIYVFDENKKLSGVVANVACPSQVVEHRSFISSDYWGKVKENLRKVYGEDLKVLGLCSAAGDQCPRDMIRWVNPETPIDDPNIDRPHYIERRADPSMFDVSGLKLVGKRISNEIISVLEELENEPFMDTAELINKPIDIDLPVRKVTVSEYEHALREIEYFINKNRGRRVNFEDNAKLQVHSGVITRYRLQQENHIVTYRINVLKFGDVAICTNPFELFLDYGNRIRALSKAKQTIIIQLCNGTAGYLPTEKAERGGHYSAYVSSGTTGHEGGDMLVRKTLKEINEMF